MKVSFISLFLAVDGKIDRMVTFFYLLSLNRQTKSFGGI